MCFHSWLPMYLLWQLLILFLNAESSTLARYSSFYLAQKVIVYPDSETKFRIVQIKYFKWTPKEEQYCTLLLASCSKEVSLNHGHGRNSRKGNLKSNVIGLEWVIYSSTKCHISNNKRTSWDQCARQGSALHNSVISVLFPWSLLLQRPKWTIILRFPNDTANFLILYIFGSPLQWENFLWTVWFALSEKKNVGLLCQFC